VCCAALSFNSAAAQQADSGEDKPLPDEAREVTFPHGVPVRMVGGDAAANSGEPALEKPAAEPETVATKAEASLQSEAGEIKEQAR